MLRKVVGPITCCLLISWGVLAAPRKEDPPPAYYHPSAVGDKLVYEGDDGQRSVEWTNEVTEARREGDALIVALRAADGRKAPTFHYKVSDKCVCKLGEDDTLYDSPECFLRLPIKKGEKWESTDAQDGMAFTIKYTCAGEEDVEVPAGRFRCIRIDSECVFDGATWTRSQWRAPRCGLVKEVENCKDNLKMQPYAPRTTVLKSFTPGGK